MTQSVVERPAVMNPEDATQYTDDGQVLSKERVWNLPWTEFASCRNHPKHAPDDWFPVSRDPDDSRDVRNICLQECPVQDLCLTAAMRSTHVGGIWGGFDEDERRIFLRRESVRQHRLRKAAESNQVRSREAR